jgi:hypothetical protein
VTIVLREKLQEITEDQNTIHHASAIAGLVGHSIESLQSSHPIELYTCAMDAFQFVGNPNYEDIATFGACNIYAGKEFIEFLLSRSLLEELQFINAKNDDLIIYFNEGMFRHIGKLISSTKVKSKWGTGGLYRHGIWEVPSSYGHEVKYFKALTPNQYFDFFIKYAEFRGLEFE